MGNTSSLWPDVLDPGTHVEGLGSGRKNTPASARGLRQMQNYIETL
jgi:ATP-dependent protease HslVU (ClpYQ) peptidase subunit